MMFRAFPAPNGFSDRTADRLLIVGPVVFFAAWLLLAAWSIGILSHLGPLTVAPQKEAIALYLNI
jgi:hypothetical protein